MCSHCSFQVVLRNLRLQARHMHNARQAWKLGRRRFSATGTPQATSSAALLTPTKPFLFQLPTLHSLSQSYSIWNTPRSTPPVPSPQAILAQNPFASHEGAAELLYALANDPSALTDIDHVVCPTLAGLLSIHHYAGARAVLERLLQDIVAYPSHQLPFGRKSLNKVISTLLGIDEHRRLPKRELHSLPAMRSMLFLVLQYLVNHPEKFSLYPLHINTLACIPEYLALRSMPLVLQLFDRLVREHPQGPGLQTNIKTLHNIMRVYALHGQKEVAGDWMRAILEVEDAEPARSGDATNFASHEDGLATSEELDHVTLPRSSASSPTEMLTTTYMTSLARVKDKEDKRILNVSSADAMRIFQGLWQAVHGSEDPSEELEPSQAAKSLDIYAWSALLHSAALDMSGISSEKLIDVLHKLQDHRKLPAYESTHPCADLISTMTASLPKPNAVTYTAVLGGLNRRGDYHIARRLVEQEIIPKASAQAESAAYAEGTQEGFTESVVLDSRLLDAIARTWTGLGDIGMACRMIEWFGRQSPAETEPAITESSNLQQIGSLEAHTNSNKNASPYPRLPENLRGTVKVDTLLVNQLMTYLAKMNRFNSVYNLFSSMTEVYNVYPDESTLAILAKTALTSAKFKKRGLIPDYAEDLWRTRGLTTQSTPNSAKFFTQGCDRQDSTLRQETDVNARESGVWDGQDPIKRVMDMYWCMLEQNFDGAHSIALQYDMRGSHGFFSFGRTQEVSAPQEGADDEAPSDTAVPVERYHVTSGLEHTASVDDYTYAWPSLHPTKINMHMLVVLSGYLGRGSDIPLIMAHMRALDIIPGQSTLCLALWLYEETGVYTREMRDFRTWLGEWLGAVPTDETVGAYRARQWGRGM